METRDSDTLLGGRYRIGQRLGWGGMAEVYDAFDERLHRSVAVKMLRADMAADPDIRRRFEAEARSAARLSNPNVVAIFDTGEDGAVPYIVMERLPGETLADRMSAGALDAHWVLRVAGDVLLALGAAHDAGIIHRDVKPGNILIAADGCAKVADFGIAKTAEVAAAADLTSTNQMLGTPAYIAPERVVGEPATAQSDLYALGVVLYEALTGTKPFTGPTPVAVAYAIRHERPAPLGERRPDLDPQVAAVVDRAMAKEPADRYVNALAMATALGVARPQALRDNGEPTLLAGAGMDRGDEATSVLASMAVPVSALVPGADDATTSAVVADDAVSADDERRAPAPHGILGDRRRLIGVAVIGVVLALGLLIIALTAGSSGGRGDRLASNLRGTADSLDVKTDGPAAGDAAAQLRAVAGASDKAGAATMMFASLAKWRDSGQLTPAAVDRIAAALRQVPGADAGAFSASPTATAVPPTTTSAPAPAVTPGASRKHGKHGD